MLRRRERVAFTKERMSLKDDIGTWMVLLVSLGFAEVRFSWRASYDSSRTFPFVIVSLLLLPNFLLRQPALALYTYLVLFLHAPTFLGCSPHFCFTPFWTEEESVLTGSVCVIASKAQALQARRSFPNLHFLLLALQTFYFHITILLMMQRTSCAVAPLFEFGLQCF
jgi:hypothetical protein